MKVFFTLQLCNTNSYYWGYMGDNGKENGNYYNGLYYILILIIIIIARMAAKGECTAGCESGSRFAQLAFFDFR